MSLQPADYRAEWNNILPGLREALLTQSEGLLPEDVFCDLKMGLAALYTCEDGFIIFRVFTDALGRRDLTIAWAYSHSQEKVISKYADQVDDIARGMGCTRMSIVSTRRGYERALPEGWRLKHICWTRDVPAGG